MYMHLLLKNIPVKIFMLQFCFGLFSAKGLIGQSRMVDSLKTELAKHPEKDTVRLDILNDLSYYYNVVNPEQGLRVAEEAVALAKYLHNDAKLAAAYNSQGVNYNASELDSLAIMSYQKSIAVKKRLGDRKGIAITLHNIGLIFFNRSDYQQALDYERRAYDIFKSLEHQLGMAETLNSTGSIFLYLADYPKSLDYYLKALKIFETLHDEHREAGTYGNIGLVYDHLSQFNKALEFFGKAEAIMKKKDLQFALQNVLTNMGNTYDNSGQPEKALEYYRQASGINKALDNQRGMASGLVNAAIVFYGKADYPHALDNLQEAMRIYKTLDDPYGMAITLSYISKCYFKAPDQVLTAHGIPVSQRYSKAAALQKRGLQMAKLSGLLKEESDAWENLSDIYQSAKESAKALNAYKNHIALRDRIINNDKKTEILRLSMQYDFDKREIAAKAVSEKKHDIALNAIERQKIIRNVTAVAAIVIIFAAGIIFLFYERKRKAISRAKEAELKAEIADVEMKALRAQMNPHFIFNSLNSISDAFNKKDIDSADNYLTKFSRLIRLILENSEHKEIPLESELKALNIYMQLEAMRMNHKFTYHIQVDDAIDPSNTLVPPLILQPFVENSIWHGIAGKEGKGNILIDIKIEGEMILCVIEDDGIGIQTDEDVNKKSLGMKITRSRISILNKLKNANASFDFMPLKEGTRVELKLPLSLSF